MNSKLDSKETLRMALKGPAAANRYRRLRLELMRARKAARLTQQEVARALNTYANFVTKVETGERHINVVEFLDLCRLYRLDISRLIKSIDKT